MHVVGHGNAVQRKVRNKLHKYIVAIMPPSQSSPPNNPPPAKIRIPVEMATPTPPHKQSAAPINIEHAIPETVARTPVPFMRSVINWSTAGTAQHRTDPRRIGSIKPLG